MFRFKKAGLKYSTLKHKKLLKLTDKHYFKRIFSSHGIAHQFTLFMEMRTSENETESKQTSTHLDSLSSKVQILMRLSQPPDTNRRFWVVGHLKNSNSIQKGTAT